MSGLKKFYHKLRFACTVNWYKTLLFNFKKFPFSIAKKLPVFFYGRVKFKSIKGDVIIKGSVKRGMIAFGLSYEMNSKRINIAELALYGTLIFEGYTQIGKDVFLYIGKNAQCEFAAMTGIASRSQVFCTHHIRLGYYTRVGDHCKISDNDFHQMINPLSKEKYVMKKAVKLGQYNYIGSHVSIGKGTETPDYCTVASQSLCTKDYKNLGENILIGGIPAKLLKENISRDWEGEDQMMRTLILH